MAENAEFVNLVYQIDKTKSQGKHTATGDSQRFRYQKPGAGRTQSVTTASIPENMEFGKRELKFMI